MYMPEGCKVKLTIYIYSFIIPQYEVNCGKERPH